jgi:hypothetical protein
MKHRPSGVFEPKIKAGLTMQNANTAVTVAGAPLSAGLPGSRVL